MLCANLLLLKPKCNSIVVMKVKVCLSSVEENGAAQGMLFRNETNFRIFGCLFVETEAFVGNRYGLTAKTCR